MSTNKITKFTVEMTTMTLQQTYEIHEVHSKDDHDDITADLKDPLGVQHEPVNAFKGHKHFN